MCTSGGQWQVFRLNGRWCWCVSVKPTVRSLYLLSPLPIITVVPSLGLSRTKAASLRISSRRNYRPGHRKKRSTPRSGPVFNFTFDSRPPFFLLHHLSSPLSSQHTPALAIEFHSSGADLYFQDIQHLNTHSLPICSIWLAEGELTI